MEAHLPNQSQGHATAVDGFGYVTNKHLFDHIFEHRAAQEQRQTFLEEMDPKVRDTKPYVVERQRRDLEIYDEIERNLIKRSDEIVNRDNYRRDPWHEEFVHTDIYFNN
jgi:hypothetical protein